MPTPPKPTWDMTSTGPFDTITPLRWKRGTAPVATPTVAVISPAEGSSHAQGASFLVQIAATAPGSSVELVEVFMDGALSLTANPTTFNSDTGYWESTLLLGGATTLGNRQITAKVTAASGQTATSAVRNITVTPAGVTAFTTFSGDTVGAQPSWLTKRWVTPNSTGIIVADGSALSGKLFRVTQTAAQRTIWTFAELAGIALGTPADVEILIRVRTSVVSATTSHSGTLVRGAGAAAAESGYLAAYRNTTTNPFRVQGFNAGANIVPNPAEGGSGVTPANTWTFILHKISGDLHQAKRWAASGAEPQGWTVEGTNDDIEDGGWLGLFTFAAAVHDFDYVSVGLNGAPAPRPA